MVNTLNKLGVEGTHLDIVKAVNDKLRANVTLHGESLKVFPLRSGIRQECPLSPLLINMILEVLLGANRQKR